MNRNLLLVAISLFAWGMGEGLFIYFQPLYLQEWGADPVMIGTIFGAMGISMAVFQIPAGYLSDRFGSRSLMWASWLLGTSAAWTMALARTLPMFVVGLILYGLTSFVMAPMNSYITNVLDPAQLTAADMVRLYGRRWDIEMAINLVKTHLKLHLWWSAKPVVIVQQIWAVLIISQILLTI